MLHGGNDTTVTKNIVPLLIVPPGVLQMLRYVSGCLFWSIVLSLKFRPVTQLLLLYLPFTKQLLRARHCTKHFTYSISFNTHNDAIIGILIPTLLHVETEAMRC